MVLSFISGMSVPSCVVAPGEGMVHLRRGLRPLARMSSGAVCEACADSFHDYEGRCARRLGQQAEQELRKASEKLEVGNELAKEWNAKRVGAGQYLLVQSSDPTGRRWAPALVLPDCAGRWTARSTSRDQPTWAWTTAVVCCTSPERKRKCRTRSDWLLASTQSPWNGASGIRQPRTTGSSRSCMAPCLKSP